MKSALAKARDKWFESDDGKKCCEGQASGQYLRNRLGMAFLAGANFSSERIKELEDVYLGQLRVIARSRITYKERVERMAALAEQALEAENSNEQ